MPRLWPETVCPALLTHGLQGWPPDGPNTFRINNGTVQYSLPLRDERGLPLGIEEKAACPSTRQWLMLWLVLEEINIWKWPASFPRDWRLKDGLEFDIEIQWGSKLLKTTGNADEVPRDVREDLLKFHDGLQKLVGWKHGISFRFP